MNKNSFLRIGGVVLAALGIAGVVYFFIQPKPLPPRSDEPYVKPEIAEAYQAINDAAAAEPESAEAVARRLEELDPENGMTYYAIAAAGGRRMDPGKMADELEKGNSKEQVIHYIAKQPAHEEQILLSRLREIGFAARTLKDADAETAARLYEAAWVAGRKISQLEPMTALNLEAGMSVRNSAAKAAVAYFEKAGDKEKASAWQARIDAMAAWDEENKEALLVEDLVMAAAEEVKLTTEELEQARNGIPLASADRQRAMEIAVVKFIEEEGKKLRAIAATLPE